MKASAALNSRIDFDGIDGEEPNVVFACWEGEGEIDESGFFSMIVTHLNVEDWAFSVLLVVVDLARDGSEAFNVRDLVVTRAKSERFAVFEEFANALVRDVLECPRDRSRILFNTTDDQEDAFGDGECLLPANVFRAIGALTDERTKEIVCVTIAEILVSEVLTLVVVEHDESLVKAERLDVLETAFALEIVKARSLDVLASDGIELEALETTSWFLGSTSTVGGGGGRGA